MEKQELHDMCKTIIDLNKQKYVIVKSEIEKRYKEVTKILWKSMNWLI